MTAGAVHLGAAVFLVLTVLAGLVRVIRGPTPGDRMLAAQLFGTTGVGALLLAAEGLDVPAARDVALVFTLLAALTVAVFVQRVRDWPPPPGSRR